ncbi:hypothetical protein DFO73_110230 [Cytobacillus oceanisediminis]|uniref:Uncharacterized protein n=1 Tax=Cytobacillus oceanisediminis TaxID=665099 RepID=A0A2V2ZQR8_9BACI|nr:hypothetical protein [Cytobacillus oceanisediminis]PWW26656.1 hypothetical protein DFO73_110230 [Cytobacillus oceanisediminis]
MGFILTFFSIWVCSFLIARLLSTVGGKGSLFSKTNWKNDFVICFAQALIITIIIVFFFATNSNS